MNKPTGKMLLFSVILISLLPLLAACGPAEPEPSATITPPPAATVVAANPAADSCQSMVDNVLTTVDTLCDATGRNQVCYGNQAIAATLRDLDPDSFDLPGDIVDLLNIEQLILSSLQADQAQWGFAVMRLQANLPETLPGENVTFLLFGNTEFAPQDDSLQAFYLRTGVTENPGCTSAPVDGLLVQTPGSEVAVDFTLNGAEFQLGSTAFIRAEPDNRMLVQMLEGEAAVTADATTRTIGAGFQSSIPLDAAGLAAGAPTEPEPLDSAPLQTLPVALLERPVRIGTATASTGSVIIEVDGAIQQAGELVEYTFQGQAGQQIFFDGESAEQDIRAAIIAPDETELLGFQRVANDNPSVLVLAQAGTYTIQVSGLEDNTGAYGFRIWDVPIPQPEVMSLSTTEQILTSGVIETPGSSDLYTFRAQAGQQLFFDGENNEQDIRTSIIAPDDTELLGFQRVGNANADVLMLEQTGTYTVHVRGAVDDTGAYSFALWEVPVPQPEAMSLSTTEQILTSGVIETPGSSDLYTFRAQAGQQLFFDGENNEQDIRASIIAPDDTELLGFQRVGNANADVLVLEQTGTYTVHVRGAVDDTGAYSFSLWEVPVPQPEAMSLSTTEQILTSGVIETPGSYDLYTFQGQAGQQIFFDGENNEQDIRANILAPDDTELLGFQRVGNANADVLVLEQTGTYTVHVRGAVDDTGAYSFALWEVPIPAPQAIRITNEEAGTLISGAIETPGSYDLYTFEAQAGQQLFFEGENAEQDIRANILAPDQSEILSFQRVASDYAEPILLAQDGTYTVHVRGTTDNTGAYAFRLRFGE